MSESTSASIGPAAHRHDDGLVRLLVALLLNRRWFVRVGASAAVLVALVLLLSPRWYSVETGVLPLSAPVSSARLAGLAAQFGIAGIGASAGQSADFYAALIASREFRVALATDSVAAPKAGTLIPFAADSLAVVRPLYRYLTRFSSTPDEDAEKAAEKLEDLVRASADRLSGIVSVRIRTRDPDLSFGIAQAVVRALQEFNNDQRRTQSTAEREYLEERLVDANDDLARAEAAVQRFLEDNRSWQASPQLVFEHERLRRELQLRVSVSTTLTDALQQARLDEVRQTPVVTIVGEPRRPARPDRRGLVMKSFLAGTAASMGFAFVIAFLVSVQGAGRAENISFDDLRADVVGDLKRPWRLFV